MNKLKKKNLIPFFFLVLMGGQLKCWSQGMDNIILVSSKIQFQAYIDYQWINDGFYSNRPENHEVPIRFSGEVLNAGSNVQTQVSFQTQVNLPLGNMVYSESYSIDSLMPADTVLFALDGFLPSVNDSAYTVSMECYQNETDQFPGDNMAADVSFTISEHRFIARHNQYTGNFAAQQYTTGNTALAGIYFTVDTIDYIESMGIFIDTLTEPGVIIIPNLFVVDSGLILKAIGMENLIDSSKIGKWVHMPIINISGDDNQLVRGEKYLLLAECYLNGHDLFIGTDNSAIHDFQLESLFVGDTTLDIQEIPLIQVELSGFLGNESIPSLSSQYKIYPNPASNYLFVDVPFSEEGYYTIYNISGKLVDGGYLPDKRIINVENLSSGIYIISISTVKNLQNFKFIKQ